MNPITDNSPCFLGDDKQDFMKFESVKSAVDFLCLIEYKCFSYKSVLSSLRNRQYKKVGEFYLRTTKLMFNE